MSRQTELFGSPLIQLTVADFVLRGCPNVAQTAVSISRSGRIPGIAIRHRNFRALIR